jgi:hypothetical protein
MWRQMLWLCGGLVLLAAAGCGGSDKSSTGAAGGAASSMARGTLLMDPPELQSSLPAAALLAQLSAAANQQLLSLGGTPVCDIAIYHLQYNTVDGSSAATTASGALMVPSGSNAQCQGPRPIVLYAHGTTTDRSFNIANLNDPQNAEGLLLAAIFASQGYIVVAPNYVGYDTSTSGYHPYLIAAAQADDMIDCLAAARSALPAAQAAATTDNGQLFIMGYSQGGYVAMATHRAMQAAGMRVTASVPMSGPYALAAFVDAEFYGQVSEGAPIVAALLITAYQHAYGNIYAAAADVFSAPYAAGIDDLLPSTLSRSQLYGENLLPGSALFDSTPPDPSDAAITPATMPASLAQVFAQGFGTSPLILNSYRLAYLQDAQTNPDGGFPTLSSGVPAASPGLPLRAALAANDLRDWIPQAPVLLCGGDQDPTVYWLNAQLMQEYWSGHANGATPTYQVLDLEAAPTASDPYAGLHSGFELAKQALAASAVLQGATDGGAGAVASAYHSTLEPPFCVSAARSFFAAQ